MRITASKGIRYPLMGEAPDPQAVMAMVFDLDAVATAEDALRATALTQRGAGLANTTGSISVAKNTAFKFTFNVTMFDPNGLTNIGVNNDRITIITPGLYLFGACWAIQPGATGLTQFEVSIAKNTTAAPAVPNFRRRKTGPTTFGTSTAITVMHPLVMANGDFVTMQTFWNGSMAGPLGGGTAYLWVAPLAIT